MSRFKSALIIGANGAIGSALVGYLESKSGVQNVIGLSRQSTPAIDLNDEGSLISAAAFLKSYHGAFDLIIVATGVLHGPEFGPEKNLSAIQHEAMMTVFKINAIGPALILKHFSCLLKPSQESVFALLSARVGSIGDNGLGGWYSYRASKAALNQIVKTASIELRRKYPKAIVVALHPGTVDTALSAPFSRNAKELQTPSLSAERLVSVIEGLGLADNGHFFDHYGKVVAW